MILLGDCPGRFLAERGHMSKRNVVSGAETGIGVTGLKIYMLERGWRNADLARIAGISPRAVGWNFSMGFPRHLVRSKIEASLNFLPIWCTPEVAAARKLCLERANFDPYLLSKSALLEKARKLRGVKVTRRTSLETIRESILSVVGTLSPSDQRELSAG